MSGQLIAVRAVLMITLTILASSALSAGMALQSPDATGDVTYMMIVTGVSAILVGAALLLTRGMGKGAAEEALAPEDVADA